jgi:hypothetical protein
MNLYFIRAGQRVKIGRSADVQRRLSALQTGCPYPAQVLLTVPIAAASIEKIYHDALKRWRVKGEWFTWCSQIQRLLLALQRGARPITQAEIEMYLELPARVRAPKAPPPEGTTAVFIELRQQYGRQWRDIAPLARIKEKSPLHRQAIEHAERQVAAKKDSGYTPSHVETPNRSGAVSR